MNLRFNNVLAISSLCLASLIPGKLSVAQEEFTQENTQVASVLGVVIANSEAWERGDVLIEMTESFDNVRINEGVGPTGAVFSSRTMKRFIFDFEKNRHLQASYENLDGTYFPSDSDTIKELDRVQVSAQLADGSNNSSWRFESTGGLYRFHEHPGQKNRSFTIRQRIADIRSFWTSATYGKEFSASSLDMRVRPWERFRVANALESFHHDDLDNLVLNYSTALNAQDNLLTKVVIDPNHQLPIEIDLSTLNSDDEKGIVGTANIEWELKNKVYVPIAMQVRTGTTINVGKRVGGLVERQYKFHWFSINEELDDRSFRKENVSKERSVLRLLDPNETGATSLLPKKAEDRKATTRDKD